MDKQKFLNLLKTNKYLQKFVTYVYRYEADKTQGGFNNLGGFNRTSGNSTAFGAGQFTTDTRNDILTKYGIDAWSPNAQDQEAAMIALLDFRGVLDEISAGNYEALNRSDLWETFTEGMPGYKPLLSDTTTNELEISEALEGERINSKYAPDESLEKMDPQMYREKMALFDKDGVFPLDNIVDNPDYEELILRASNVQRNIKDKIDAEKPNVKTKTRVSRPDVSSLSRSQQDVFNILAKRIEDIDEDVETKNELLKAVARQVSQSQDLDDLKRIAERTSTRDLLRQKESVDIRNLESRAEKILKDPNVSYNDRVQLQNLLDARKSAKVSRVTSYGTGLTKDSIDRKLRETEALEKSNKDLLNFLNNLRAVPTPTKTESPDTPTTPGQAAQPKFRKEVPSISLDPVALKSTPVEEMSDVPERGKTPLLATETPQGITKAGEAIMKARIAAMKVGEGIRNLGISGESVSNALRAGAGILSLYEAQKKDKVNKARVSPLMLEAVRKAEQISNTGMPYEQKMAAIKDLNNAYSGAMKNVMAISGGQRGAALAGIGAVDASRVNALVDLAAKSSDMRMEGMKMFQQAVGDYTQAKLTADMSNEKLQKSLDQARKDRISRQGISLYEQAMEFNRNFKDQENNEALISAINNASQTDSDSNQYAMSALAQMFANIGAGGSDTEDTTENLG